MNRLSDPKDTICAIATPHGVGSIGVIRVSGREALAITQKIFKGAKPLSAFPSHTVHRGTVVDPNAKPIDEALLMVMRGPRSYTGEDVVEIQSHGNPHLLQRILSSLLTSGARLAEPGEFTRRAFLSGRIDLSQAEAVMELITAQSRSAEEMALRQLQGDLSQTLHALRDAVVLLLAQIEASIDFTEQGIQTCSADTMVSGIRDLMQSVEQLLVGYETGRQIREGSVVVLTGRPNAGKSSIMNRLLGEDRAIVTPIPGTTRDTLSEAMMLNGHRIHIVDTAGFHETAHPIEQEGMRRSTVALQQADLVLFVLDATRTWGSEEAEIANKIGHQKKIIVINKCDLAINVTHEEIAAKCPGDRIVSCSAKTGERFSELRHHLVSLLIPKETDTERQPHVCLLRQKNQLLVASVGLKQALQAAQANASVEFIAADLRTALDALGEIVGATTSDVLLDAIFSRFCIGK